MEVLRLKADHCYTIKLVATNSDNISAISDAIRIQTLPTSEPVHTLGDAEHELPAILQYPLSSPPHPHQYIQSRDVSTAQQSSSRSVADRRSSPPTHTVPESTREFAPSSDTDDEGSSDVLRNLTQTLESLKVQRKESENQIDEEEADAKMHHSSLVDERDKLRHLLKEKEESSADLRRHGNQLDKLNRAAQSRRTAKQKALQTKKSRRQKLKNDASKWDAELSMIATSIKSLQKDLMDLSASRTNEMIHLRKALSADQISIKTIEDEIRLKGAQIKEIEQRRDQLSDFRVQQHDSDKDEVDNIKGDIWEAKYQALQSHLQSLWSALQQSKHEEQQAEEHLSWWMANREISFDHFSTHPFAERPSALRPAGTGRPEYEQLNSALHSDQMGNRSLGSHLPPPPPYQPNSGLFQERIDQQASPFERSARSALSADHGFPGDSVIGPAANDLLPSYLLRDDDTTSRDEISTTSREADKDVDNHFIHHSFHNSDVSIRGLNTPVSASSKNGSVFTSPHNSTQNVSIFRAEGDSQSLNPANNTVPTRQGSDSIAQPIGRFANLFSSPFGRQRGKSNGHGPPALGTLKQGQSQSFPRHIEQEVLDTSGLRRRRGSHDTWANPVAGLLGRNSISPESPIDRARTASGRSARLNVFKPRMQTLDSGFPSQEPSSPRPSSTYSYDQPFGRTSNEGPNIWGPVGDALHSRGGSANITHVASWSRDASRRTSLGQKSFTNLSLGSTPLDAQDLSRASSKHRTEQAPIGTRPVAQPPLVPRLNPTAPSFKTLFSRSDGRKAAKAEKSSGKNVELVKRRENEGLEADNSDLTDDASPAQSRMSRDAQSIATAASTADSRDSFEHNNAGTTSDSPTPRETLMQKITRKSSSSKFNVPWSKDRGMFSKRAGEPSASGDNDDGSSEVRVSDGTSAPHTPREEKRAWTSIRRKPKKGYEKESEGEAHD